MEDSITVDGEIYKLNEKTTQMRVATTGHESFPYALCLRTKGETAQLNTAMTREGAEAVTTELMRVLGWERK